MTGTSLTIEVDDAEVRAALNSLADAGGNLGTAFRVIGEYLLASTRDRFTTQAAPDGTPWAPLSDAWRRRKVAKGRDPRILIMRGYLSGMAPGQLAYQADGDGVRVGTMAVYGAIHQFGGEITRHAHTVLGSFLNFREAAATVKNKKGEMVHFTAKRFSKAGKGVVAMARRVAGAGTAVLPARPWLGLSADDTTRITEIVGDFLVATHGGGHAAG